MTCVLLVLRPVIRAAPVAFLSCPLVFSSRFYICCWINKERKKETAGLWFILSKYQTLATLLDCRSGVIPGLWEMQSPVTAGRLIGVHGCFKLTKEKSPCVKILCRRTKNSAGDEIHERDIGSCIPLAFNAPSEGVPLGRSP